MRAAAEWLFITIEKYLVTPPKNLIQIIFKQNFGLETQNVAAGFKIDGKILPEMTIECSLICWWVCTEIGRPKINAGEMIMQAEGDWHSFLVWSPLKFI